jgi:hypothetical protein
METSINLFIKAVIGGLLMFMSEDFLILKIMEILINIKWMEYLAALLHFFLY